MAKTILFAALLTLPLVVSTILSGASAGIPCTLSKDFWDEAQSKCIPCTQCGTKDIIVRPCQAHKDTVCGPLSKLQFDWSNIIPARSHRLNDTGGHGHKKNHRNKIRQDLDALFVEDDVEVDIGRHRSDDGKKSHHNKKKGGAKKVLFEDLFEDYTELDSEVQAFLEEDEEEMKSLDSGGGLVGAPTIPVEEKSPPVTNADVSVTSPFTTTEYLVWDWQVAALFGGAAACVLLLAVLIFLTVYQLCGWYRTKEPIPDPEEESVRASLFPNDVRESPESGISYHSNQCLYLEQLLERKSKSEESGSNVYVEDGMPPS